MTDVMVDPNRKQTRSGRNTRLTRTQINNLVAKYNEGETQRELAKEYSVSVSTVQRYIRQRTPGNPAFAYARETYEK